MLHINYKYTLKNNKQQLTQISQFINTIYRYTYVIYIKGGNKRTYTYRED